ncbi:MAG: hypothetical protein QM523_02450 [Candidatus Pacebacteria bacterium]|nr:hypothetical protein [Candidatus Paceibacterota bacterium]
MESRVNQNPAARVQLAKREQPHEGLLLTAAMYRGSFTGFAR